MKTLVVGLGNSIMSDDGAGILVARELHGRLKDDSADFMELPYAGWRFIDFLSRYEHIIIVDVIEDDAVPPGECCEIEIPQRTPLHMSNSHGLGFFEALELARSCGMVSTVGLSVYAIGARNVRAFGEEIDPRIMTRVPGIVGEIINSEQNKGYLVNKGR